MIDDLYQDVSLREADVNDDTITVSCQFMYIYTSHVDCSQ